MQRNRLRLRAGRVGVRLIEWSWIVEGWSCDEHFQNILQASATVKLLTVVVLKRLLFGVTAMRGSLSAPSSAPIRERSPRSSEISRHTLVVIPQLLALYDVGSGEDEPL